MAGDISRKNGEKGGRPLATATLQTQMMREQLTKAVYEVWEEIYEPQIKKARKGDLAAFNSLIEKVLSKPATINEHHEVKDYKLDDEELTKINRGLVKLQKEGKYTSGTRA